MHTRRLMEDGGADVRETSPASDMGPGIILFPPRAEVENFIVHGI